DSEKPVISNQREYRRGDVSITADIREHGGGRQQVEVVDLSQSGFRMRTGSFIPQDKVIFLTLPGYNPLRARIAWHEREVYGCEFVQRLHEAIYDNILQKYPHFGPDR
ncbi:MAG: PilZ domain-containing protein, partial [Sphingomonadaceae bacterium]|nr:PilZ domain-containing protein [Sphingomonadaceae bacterium]